MKSGNISQLTEQLDSMVEALGLEKLSAEGPVGESAGVIADPGTANPAEQEAARSNIEPATEGSQSASNNQMLKEEVPGDNTATANPSDADNSGAASSTENITTATMVGENPKVEDDFGSRQQTLDAPSTEHPADVNKDPEKYSSQLRESASLIDQEIEKLSAYKHAEKDAEATVGDRMGDILLGKEASAEDKDAAVVSAVTDYLGGYAKTASLIGEMTADALDILSKQAEEMMPETGAEEAGAIPAAELEAASAEEGAVADEEAAALAQAAEMLSAELGVSPEEVLNAAAEELVAGGAGEEMAGDPAEAPADEEAAALAQSAEMLAAELGVSPEEVLSAAAEEVMAGGAGEEMAGAPAEEAAPVEDEVAEAEEGAKLASAKEAEIAELRKKAEELDNLKSAQAKAEQEGHLQSLVSSAVSDALNKALAAQKQ